MYKISGTGWLCYRSAPHLDWIPVCKLTDEQLREVKEVVQREEK